MPKRSSKTKQHRDANQIAAAVVDAVERLGEASSTPSPAKEKNPAAVALGRLGGLKGGKARAERLSPEARREIAKKAAKTRWSRKET